MGNILEYFEDQKAVELFGLHWLDLDADQREAVKQEVALVVADKVERRQDTRMEGL